MSNYQAPFPSSRPLTGDLNGCRLEATQSKPTVQQWNNFLDEARKRRVIQGPDPRGGFGRSPSHPWKVSAQVDPLDPATWVIRIVPAAVNDQPWCIPYKIDGDLRPRQQKLMAPQAPASSSAPVQSADVACYDPDPPYLLAKLPPYTQDERPIFAEVSPFDKRPAYFQQEQFQDALLYRTSVQLSASTNPRLVPFFVNVTPPPFFNYRVFVAPPVSVSVARAAAFITIANLWLVRRGFDAAGQNFGDFGINPLTGLPFFSSPVFRKPGAESKVEDAMYVDQQLFYSIGSAIVPPPGEFNLPPGVSDVVGGLGAALALGGGLAFGAAMGVDLIANSLVNQTNAFLSQAFESAEHVATWTQ